MRIALIALCLAAARLPAADWMQFRGPHGNGVSDETGAPAALDAKSIAWTADLPGRGLSSPIIIGDRVIVTCSSGPRQERLHVLCFNAADGAKRWERQFWATGRTMTQSKTCVAAPTFFTLRSMRSVCAGISMGCNTTNRFCSNSPSTSRHTGR